MILRASSAIADGLEIVLYPQRSLGTFGLRVAVGIAAVASLATGAAVALMGGWPVCGFLGLDVLLLAWALRYNARSGQVFEVLTLTPAAVILRRVGADGEVQSWTFHPSWLRVRLEEPPGRTSRLILSSHGQHVTVGAFLSPPERAEVARRLRQATEIRQVPAATM